ncbi:hypothetical protein [Desulforhopalus sp. 52FAK]
MKIYCPHCGVKGSADDSYSGRKIKCPKCQGMFDLKPDMAIDQDEFLTADLGAETVAETQGQEVVRDEPTAEVASPVESALAELNEEPFEDSLDLDDEIDQEVDDSAAEVDAEEQLDEEGDDLDWGSFEADLDKEIAASEQAEAQASDELEDFGEDEGPVVDLGDSDLSISDDELELAEEPTLADDLGDVLGTVDQDDDALFDESLDTPVESDEDLTDIEEVAEIIDAVDQEIEVEEIEDEDSNLATLTAPDVAMPLFAGDDDKQREEIVTTKDSSPEEVMSFADADLPEVDEHDQPDVVIGDDTRDVVVEDEPYGIDKEQCWQCGKKDSVGEPFVAIDGRLYCTECSPAEEGEEAVVEPVALAGANLDGGDIPEENLEGDEETKELKPQFTVGGVIKEAWEKVKGIKGAVWAASAVMYLLLIVIVAGGSMLLPSDEIGTESLTSFIPSALFQFVTQALYMIFMGGLFFMGIRRVAGDKVSWKMIFHGFSFTGKIIVVTILQSILITIGFVLLILPGIYLSVGYVMAIPLIVDKNLSPWQALETSRKAVHKVWWKVAGIGLLTCLLFTVAAIPLGIGLIWVWPLALVISGVVYNRLFGK